MFIDYMPLSDCKNDELIYESCLQCNKCKRFNKTAKEKSIKCSECGTTNYYIKEPKQCIECYSDLVEKI